MSTVDGYIADGNDDVGPLFECYVNGDAELVDGGPAKVSQVGRLRPADLGQHRVDGDRAKDLAGQRTVAVAAGEVGGQALALGLVEEVAMESCRWCSAPASGTSGRSTPSTCWRTPTWSSAATGCCTCATGFAAEGLDGGHASAGAVAPDRRKSPGSRQARMTGRW